MRFVLAALLVIAAAPLHANDLFLPVVGKAAGHDGRAYWSEVEITALAATEVTVSHLAASQPNPNPRTEMYRLAAGERRVVDDFDGFGALRIQSTENVQAVARFFSRKEAVQQSGGTMRAMGAWDAIGIGQFARLPGIPVPGSRAKLYVVETNGHPLFFAAALLDQHGKIVAEKRLYLSAHEPRSYDLAAEFPNQRGAALRLHGVNGDGRLLAVLSYIDNTTAEATMHPMSRTSKRRHRFTAAEIATYATAALGLLAFAAIRRK